MIIIITSFDQLLMQKLMTSNECKHERATFQEEDERVCNGTLTLNEDGEAGFYCKDCNKYMIACLACSNMEYDYSDDELCTKGDRTEEKYNPCPVWCRFIGVHVEEDDLRHMNCDLRSLEDHHSNLDEDFHHRDLSSMNHYVGDYNLHAIPSNYLSDEMFVTGSCGGNPLWWKCDKCQSVYYMTDK